MRDRVPSRVHRWTLAQALAATALVVAGCVSVTEEDPCADGCSQGTCGEAGVLRFVDATDDPVLGGADGALRPVAAGASLALRMALPTDDQVMLVPVEASPEDDGFAARIFGGRVVLDAGEQAGSTRVEVEVESGERDAITLERRLPTSGRIVESVPDMLAVLAGCCDDEGPPNLFAMMPGASIRYSVQWSDAEGEALAGYGLANWSVGSGVTVSPAANFGDAIRVHANEDAKSGTVELRAGEDVRYMLQIRTIDDATSVRFVDADDSPLGDVLVLPRDEVVMLFADVRDAAGRVLVPARSQGATLTVDPGASNVVEVVDRPTLDYFEVRGMEIGEAACHLHYGGLSQPITVRVE